MWTGYGNLGGGGGYQPGEDYCSIFSTLSKTHKKKWVNMAHISHLHFVQCSFCSCPSSSSSHQWGMSVIAQQQPPITAPQILYRLVLETRGPNPPPNGQRDICMWNASTTFLICTGMYFQQRLLPNERLLASWNVGQVGIFTVFTVSYFQAVSSHLTYMT